MPPSDHGAGDLYPLLFIPLPSFLVAFNLLSYEVMRRQKHYLEAEISDQTDKTRHPPLAAMWSRVTMFSNATNAYCCFVCVFVCGYFSP